MELIPLVFAVPLLAAALLSALSTFLPRSVIDAISTLVAAAVMVMCALLVAFSTRAPLVYPFGGFRPSGGVVIGILFVVDPLNAGLAALAAGLVTANFIFTWRYFKEVRGLYHVLVLVFLAAMVGFCLTGDLFNLFVFFELMSAAAITLTGYKVEDKNPLQGALNFGITNSLGAFLVLIGIALLYGRTGALNMAQIGHALSGKSPDGLVITSFTLITAGLFTKAAIVPFHFWLADAEAVAPAPVCMLFSGVMDELALYGLARIYWTIFADSVGNHAFALRAVLVAFGVVTALLGAVMCLLQHHLKRLLAFSTLSHMGLFLIGLGLLSPLGLAGAAIYVLGHALVKGALFLGVGILLHRFNSMDENALRGRGRRLPYTGVLFFAGALGLASLPPFGTYLGKGMIEDAAGAAGYSWAVIVLIISSLATGGAVLRVTGSVFLGLGHTKEDPTASNEGAQHEEEESKGTPGRTPKVMFFTMLALLVAAFVVGLLPNLSLATEMQAAHFQDASAYAAAVLGGVVRHVAPPPPLEPAGPTISMGVTGILSTIGAALYALLALFHDYIPGWLRRLGVWLVHPQLVWLRAIQSGHIGDYITWLTVGLAILAAACVAVLH